jgi:hypothetical protein
MKDAIDDFSSQAAPADRQEPQHSFQRELFSPCLRQPCAPELPETKAIGASTYRDAYTAGKSQASLPEFCLTDNRSFAAPPIRPAEHSAKAEQSKTGSQPRPDSGWVIPIGANSSDKKKNVPLEAIEKPDPKLPDVWPHPPSTKLDGKCGITGVSNLLRLYGIEKPPADIDKSHFRSWGPGMRVNKFAEDMRELSGKNFTARSINDGSDPLAVLQKNIDAGKPVAIMYMTSPTDAHWVVVTGIKPGSNGPELQVQSWGAYHKVAWRDVQDQWRRGYGGNYPYVVGDQPSSFLKRDK